MWERRYGVVKPQRSATNRRAYTAEDVRRLTLLQQLTAAGQAISYLAPLSTEQLERLASEPPTVGASGNGGLTPEAFIEQGVGAIQKLDARGLETVLTGAETELGLQGSLQRVIGPLAQRIGDLWRDGTLTAAHEHFASAVLRTLLGQAARPYAGVEHAPAMVMGTPGGQLHELGALIVTALAANLGWRVIYLGAAVPVAEIAGTARQNQARLVGLSLVYPEDDPRLEGELLRLRELLPPEIAIVVGGRAAGAYEPVLQRIGAIRADSLDDFGQLLDRMRTPGTVA